MSKTKYFTQTIKSNVHMIIVTGLYLGKGWAG